MTDRSSHEMQLKVTSELAAGVDAQKKPRLLDDWQVSERKETFFSAWQ